jgi:outer membrane protein OmpA-like peptidoglycan-associated protein
MSQAISSLPNSLAAMLAAGLLLAGCAGTQTVILVPDPDGKVGKVEVTTAGGKQSLNKPSDMTKTVGAASAPAPVTTANATYLANTFKEALAIEPPPGEKFVFYYSTSSAVPSGDYQTIISDIAAAVKRRNALTIRISGHTDTTGSDDLDIALSLERVKNVQAMLQEKGIKVERISATYHGKGNPAVPTADGVAEARNRRVVIIVH